MARQFIVVDPLFARRLAELRAERGLSLRDLGSLVHLSHTHLSDLERAKKPVYPDIATRLDQALDAGGQLSRLVRVEPSTDGLDRDAVDRLAAVAARPRTVDAAAVESLAVLLAQQRRLEDLIGSRPMLPIVRGQLGIVESLAGEARGAIRAPVVRVAAQWAQHAGWLAAASGDHGQARCWYATALEWATEVGDTDMVATALSMRGHLAWLVGEIGPTIGLSHAAGELPASPGTRSLAAQQEARGHAQAGDGDPADRLLDRAVELAIEAAAHPEDEPPWQYFRSVDYLDLQRGLVHYYLGRYASAVDLLTTGLARMAPGVRGSEWIGPYVYRLGVSHLGAGDRDAAGAALAELDAVHEATAATRLGHLAGELRARLAAVS